MSVARTVTDAVRRLEPEDEPAIQKAGWPVMPGNNR